MDLQLRRKQQDLTRLLRSYERVVVAYSGGVDSTLLTAVAHASLGNDALAVTAVSPSLAQRDKVEAERLARERGWNHIFVNTRELDRDAYARNASDRCYWCKSELFEVIAPLALQRSARMAIGTNLDDLSDHRPGLRAAVRYGVVSPLAEVGLAKVDIRALSEDLGLPTARKPASPCLASRLAYGIRVTPEALRRVEEAETFVRGLGFEVVRVRDHGAEARVEVGGDRVSDAVALEGVIADQLRSLGYQRVSVDPAGYRMGSLNDLLITRA